MHLADESGSLYGTARRGQVLRPSVGERDRKDSPERNYSSKRVSVHGEV